MKVEPTRDPDYQVGCAVQVALSETFDGRVRLSLLGNHRTWHSRLTPAEAKRVAHALLLAADGEEPE